MQDQAKSAFDIVPLQRFAQGGSWRTEAMRSYARPVLLWFTKGQGRITISGVKRGYGAHNAIFLPAGTMHGFDMLGQVFGQLVFLPDDPALRLPTEALHLRIRDVRRQAQMNGLIDQLAEELARDDAESARALYLTAGLLAVWLNRNTDLRDPDFTEQNAATRLVAAYAALLERDFHRPKSVAAYAAELGVTPTHLSRACNYTMGRPASELRADRLHLEARRLLRRSDKPIKEIAAELGFASAAYFTRAFTRSAGRTPSEFRKSGADVPV